MESENDIDTHNVKYKNNLPYELYGEGHGLESVHPLQFWIKEDDEDDWEDITEGKSKKKGRRGRR